MDQIADFITNLIPAKYAGYAIPAAAVIGAIIGAFALKTKTKLDDKAAELFSKIGKKKK